MTAKPRVGFIGVGLMGHGAAKNLLEKGHPLVVLGNRNRQPVDDLVQRGAVEARNPADLASRCDVIIVCVPSSVEVEQVVNGPNGLATSCRAGQVLIDATTADPNETRRIAAQLKKKGVDMIDAPLGRTPKEAEAGRLSTYVGGDAAVVARVRPILECYADTIVETGGIGTGTTCKLINNFISIGTSAVISEALATAAKLGVDFTKLHEVISAGGAYGRMYQMLIPWVLEGDDSNLKGPLRIAHKDLRTYARIAESAPALGLMAQAAAQTYQLAILQGNADRFMPVLPGILAQLNGTKIRDLP